MSSGHLELDDTASQPDEAKEFDEAAVAEAEVVNASSSAGRKAAVRALRRPGTQQQRGEIICKAGHVVAHPTDRYVRCAERAEQGENASWEARELGCAPGPRRRRAAGEANALRQRFNL